MVVVVVVGFAVGVAVATVVVVAAVPDSAVGWKKTGEDVACSY
jgi:hypothetical protein